MEHFQQTGRFRTWSVFPSSLQLEQLNQISRAAFALGLNGICILPLAFSPSGKWVQQSLKLNSKLWVAFFLHAQSPGCRQRWGLLKLCPQVDGRCALGSQEVATYFRKVSSSLRPLDGPPSLWFPILSPLAHSLCFCDSVVKPLSDQPTLFSLRSVFSCPGDRRKAPPLR